ncbi:helix-turn-helix domain-containing protein [Streptomyces sp. SID13031]|uniref:helix-turn-helix domain-containing protein n=1 Tax=Streptomyces sp. SID13031 TaxID=2706046 RepID=UPI0013C6F99F|nr:helix-turn-helix domain-containing protein [Streptomyces sp. SID13031]NEA36011.1 helix-turn-helix domain-containing protein [Streptomyces sp. SID13031]
MPAAPTTDLARLLRRFRARSGLTQEALAAVTGLSTEAIGALEGGRRRQPRPTTIAVLAKALDLSEDESQLFERAARRPVAGSLQLPAPIADFTGRSSQLDELVQLLRSPYAASPGVVISAIGGMGGIGKTTLAAQAAQQVVDEFPDGQFSVNLHGGSAKPLSTADALRMLLQALGVPPTGTDDLEETAARYRSALAGRRVLLLLDDATSVDQVRLLMPGTPGTAVVITSRQQLAALPGVRRLDLDVLTEPEALQLLGEVAGHHRVIEEPDAAREVVSRCGFLPLAIRIAGQSGRTAKGLQGLVAQLTEEGDRRALLTGPGAGVSRSILVSLVQLERNDHPEDEATAKAFPRLALFDGDHFPLRAAAKILGKSLDTTEAMLERLVDIHLLETPAPQLYRMHDLVRDVGRALARTELSDSELAEIHERELTCYLGVLSRLGEMVDYPDLYGARGERPWSAGAEDLIDREEVVSWLRDELPNLVRLIRVAAGGDAAERLTAVRMALGMPRISTALMRFGEAYTAARTVVRIPVELDPRLEAGRLYQMGFMEASLGLYEASVPWKGEALPLARKLEDPTLLTVCLIDLGYGLGRAGRSAEGMPYAEEALALIERHRIHRFEVGANVAVGALAGWLGDLERQRAAFDRAISLMPSRSALGPSAAHRSLIGRSLQEAGQYEASLEVLNGALADARAAKLEITEADLLRELGCTYLELGDWPKAHEALASGLEIALRFPSDYREPPLRHYLGRAFAGLGRPAEARREWKQALTKYRQTADHRTEEVVELLAGLEGDREGGGGLEEGRGGRSDEGVVDPGPASGGEDPADRGGIA